MIMTLIKVEQNTEEGQNSVSKKSKMKRKNENIESKKSFKKTKLLSLSESMDEPKTKQEVKSEKVKHKKLSKKPKLFTEEGVSSEGQTINHEIKQEGTDNKAFVKKGKKEKPFNKKISKKMGEKNKLGSSKDSGTKKWESSKHSSPEKVKLCHMTKKERKALRQKAKTNFDLGRKLKLLWEEFRIDTIEEEKKQQLLKEVSSLVKGHALQLIFAHDTVRVIECLVAVGTEAHRAMLFEELKESIIPLAKSKYAKNVVIKILRYGTQEQKTYVMNAFRNKVVHLMKHKEAAIVVETVFNECANATRRAEMVREFYGPHSLYFTDTKIYNLTELLKEKPNQKASIIEYMKNSLEKVLQKGAHRHSLIHCVLRQFMTHADYDSQREIIESVQKLAVEILHTKDGSRAIMSCVWNGSAKARKAIVKNLKGHVSKIAQEEFGHMVLLAIFDCVDDTRLVEKHIISEMLNDGKDIFLNLYGRKVIVYLVSPRDPLHFHPDVISILNQGDNNETSKKDPELRKSELRDVSSPLILKALCDNMEVLVTDNAGCLLIVTILKHASGDLTEVYQLLARYAAQPYFLSDENSVHFIESTASVFLLKKLIAADKEKQEGSFSEVLLNEVPHGNFKSWIECNRGAFLLVHLLETGIPSVVERITEEMKNLKKAISRKSYAAAKILLKLLIKDD